MNSIIKLARNATIPSSALHSQFRAIMAKPRQIQYDMRTILPSFVRPGMTEYERHTLVKTSAVELAVLTWPPGSGTKWHGHDGQVASFAVLSGELVEIIRGHDGQLAKFLHKPFDVAQINDDIGTHVMMNPGVLYVHTLHLYTKINE